MENNNKEDDRVFEGSGGDDRDDISCVTVPLSNVSDEKKKPVQ